MKNILWKFTSLNQFTKKRVWGGTGFSKKLNRSVPDNLKIGESWEIVDRDEDQSVVTSGKHKGFTLRQLIADHSEYLMGPTWPKDNPFPLLIKWLDCSERLSLQVHPPKEISDQLGESQKLKIGMSFRQLLKQAYLLV